jgi:uncharacterized RDD family membrane protein YckC
MSGIPGDSAAGAAGAGRSTPPPGYKGPEPRPAGLSAGQTSMLSRDRKALDSTRLLAVLIDGVLLLPVALVLSAGAGSWDFDVTLVIAAISLSYFFICESLFGQTLGKRARGLRVLLADGRPAPVNAIAARNVLRVIDVLPNVYLVGALVMIFSGKRRQRIGDLVAGTIVTRAEDGAPPPAPSVIALCAYPAAWLAIALLGIGLVG